MTYTLEEYPRQISNSKMNLLDHKSRLEGANKAYARAARAKTPDLGTLEEECRKYQLAVDQVEIINEMLEREFTVALLRAQQHLTPATTTEEKRP